MSRADSFGSQHSAQELLAVCPGPAFGFEGAWAGPGHVATAAPSCHFSAKGHAPRKEGAKTLRF